MDIQDLVTAQRAYFNTGATLPLSARRAALHAGKVLAAAAIDLLADPSLLAAAKAEFQKRTEGGYVCPIPQDAVPTIAD